MKLILSEHDERLQSLRGLAALSVMIGHASLLLPPTRFALVVGTLFEQNSAVIFFYVLSGFVLGESLRRGGGLRVFAFRRLARLAPAAWASIILGIGIAMALRHGPITGASGWFNQSFLAIATAPADIVLNLAGISVSINGALWSIQVEIVMVAILPAALVLADRLSGWQNVGAAIVLCIVSGAVLLPASFVHPQLRPVGVYVYCFYLGLLIPRALAAPAPGTFLRSGLAVLAGLAAVALCHVLASLGLLPWQMKFVLDALVSLQIIAYVAGARHVASVLRHRLLVGLGDCSYSFYAYGQLVLAASAFALFRLSPSPWWTSWPAAFIGCALALALAINIPLAYGSYRWIERPFTELGRALTRRQHADGPAQSAGGDDRVSVADPSAPAPGRA
jgi:peptidoglycan/LPS O-acetylase OafA/YrhL